jgi:hypothetical protein
VKLADVLQQFRPESHGGTRGRTWPQHANYLWNEDPDYMWDTMATLRDLGWFGSPVTVHDKVVQDGHHRLVAAADLGLGDLDIPVEVRQ